jgi:ABC-type sugar transport system permease subunit
MKTRRYVSFERKKAKWGYVFVLPLLFGMIFCFGIPFIKTVWYSLSKVNIGLDGINLERTGVLNYYNALFKDIFFREYAVSSLLTMLINIPLLMVFAFFSASILNTKFRGRSFVRALFFLPLALTSSAFMSFTLNDGMTQLMSNELVNNESLMTLQSYNIGRWLMDNGFLPKIASDYLSVAFDRIKEIINYSTVQILIFLTALQSAPKELYEAARVEGATGWELFWKITFPLSSTFLLPCAIYTIVDWSMSINNKAAQYLNDMGMKNYDFGLSAAMAIIYSTAVLLCIAAVTILMKRMVKKYDS